MNNKIQLAAQAEAEARRTWELTMTVLKDVCRDECARYIREKFGVSTNDVLQVSRWRGTPHAQPLIVQVVLVTYDDLWDMTHYTGESDPAELYACVLVKRAMFSGEKLRGWSEKMEPIYLHSDRWNLLHQYAEV